ncbi:hypothetical protein T265_11031 [Opisthorchis viverrini]|uniref:Trematode PH-like domain-containing protein n=1 Tax=Opisthorchis viverrini TaxID=6198 RepID=A0A074Z4F4_OPIVI|nr:hypothetical protein T265_11031 [Opisthorchis viverrini]KER20407.1 hypothetical protein T265_11031 [Opisthorchis viverrini]
MTVKRRGKEDDKSSVIQTERGQNVDKKTKQLLFFHCEMETIKQVFLKSSEEFSQTGANRVYEKYYKKRQSKCKAYCLIDRIRFQKRGSIGSHPFRKELTYREIKHFFVFPSNPSVFMLCTTSEKNGKRAYEAFRCAPECVSVICDLTYRASTDPQNILRGLALADHKYSNGYGKSYISNSELYLDGDPFESAADLRSHDDLLSCDPHMIIPGTPALGAYLESSSSSDFLPRKPMDQCVPQKSSSLNAINVSNTHKEKTVTGVYSYYELHEPEHRSPSPGDSRLRISHPSPHPLSNKQIGYKEVLTISPPFDMLDKDSPIREKAQIVQGSMKHFNTSPKNQLVSIKSRPRSQDELEYNEVKKTNRIIIERDIDNGHNLNVNQRRSMSIQNLLWGDEVTYISSDPTKGINVTENGPIFMYITRYASQQDLSSIKHLNCHFNKSSNLYSFTEEEFRSNDSDIK